MPGHRGQHFTCVRRGLAVISERQAAWAGEGGQLGVTTSTEQSQQRSVLSARMLDGHSQVRQTPSREQATCPTPTGPERWRTAVIGPGPALESQLIAADVCVRPSVCKSGVEGDIGESSGPLPLSHSAASKQPRDSGNRGLDLDPPGTGAPWPRTSHLTSLSICLQA